MTERNKKARKNRSVHFSNHWKTPDDFYDKLDKEFNFDFDPCPGHSEFDGLKKEWGDSNFVNPPYDKKIKTMFIIKSIREAQKGKVCVCLLPVSPSTQLFHNLILPNASEIRFVKGRLKFININDKDNPKEATTYGMHDSMVVIFRGKKNECRLG